MKMDIFTRLQKAFYLLTIVYFCCFFIFCYWEGYMRDEYAAAGDVMIHSIFFIMMRICMAVLLVVCAIGQMNQKIKKVLGIVGLCMTIISFAVLAAGLIYYVDMRNVYVSEGVYLIEKLIAYH